MATKRRAADYEHMADEFERTPPVAAGPVELGAGAHIELREGRPAGRKVPAGNTPTMSVRLPKEIRGRLDDRAAAESVKPAEIIRRAVVEYLDRHSA